MSNANRAILLGRLGNDPDVGVIPGTQTVAAKLSIATTEKWRDKQSGEQKEKTTWHNVKAYGRTAEVIRDYLKKGALVYIEGSMQNDKYQKDGKDVYFHYVKANMMQMVSGKSENIESPVLGTAGGSVNTPRPTVDTPVPLPAHGMDDGFQDKDIPF